MRRTRLLRARCVEGGDSKSIDSNSTSDGSKYGEAVEGGFKMLVKCPPADQEEAYDRVNGIANVKV
jgi:hypothetical protein